MTKSYPFVVSGDEFKGRRVLVTGGTKGVGEAIVRRLSGASVATTARSEPAPGQAPALFIRADLGTSRVSETSSIAFCKSGVGSTSW